MIKVFGFVALVSGIILMNMRKKMKWFSPAEFGLWYPLINRDLLKRLDEFRERWGAPVVISKADGGIGRHGNGESQHNVDRWGSIRAIDVFPMVDNGSGARYIDNAADLARAYEVARDVGFTGIGVYTDTEPGYMVHLDVRDDREPGNPAQWSRVNGEYLGVEAVIA